MFKEISKIGEDYVGFVAWVNAKHAEAQRVKLAVAQMREHMWFPHFIKAIAGDPNEWGTSTDALAELNLWNEWLAHAEQQLIATSRREGEAVADVARADPRANMETQMLPEDYLALPKLCTCKQAHYKQK